jgi:hypothetical protein
VKILLISLNTFTVNWIFGSGAADNAATISKLHAQGYIGPPWKYLVS